MLLVANSSKKKFTLAGWLIKAYERTNYSHSIIIHDDFVYEAIYSGYRKISLESWLVKNKILYFQDAVAFFGLSEDQVLNRVEELESLLTDDIPYGSFTLLGIILKDTIKLKWFRDGRKSLICSELVYRIFKNWLPLVSNADYVTPKDIFRMFSMKKNTLGF